jgi:hypothetical protein
MKSIFKIAKFTYRELIRNHIAIVWVIFAIAIAALDYLLSMLSYGYQKQVFIDLGLGGIEFAGVLTLLLSLAVTYVTEFDQRAIYLQIVKPLTKGEYLLGRILGFIGINWTIVLGMSFLIAGILWFYGASVNIMYWEAVIGLLLEMIILNVVGLTFQMIGTSMAGVVLYTLFTIILGHLLANLKWLLHKHISSFMKIILNIFYYIFPNLEIFNIKDRMYLPHHVLSLVQWESILLYTFTYSFFAFLVGWIAFEKREFK